LILLTDENPQTYPPQSSEHVPLHLDPKEESFILGGAMGITL
jgi:hypothetical protein